MDQDQPEVSQSTAVPHPGSVVLNTIVIGARVYSNLIHPSCFIKVPRC